MPLRSATADTVAPGSSASVRTLTFCSAVQRLRRSTREMISPTLSIGVLTHVFKDANAHDLRQHNKGSSGLTLTVCLLKPKQNPTKMRTYAFIQAARTLGGAASRTYPLSNEAAALVGCTHVALVTATVGNRALVLRIMDASINSAASSLKHTASRQGG